jgi:hypothetical protein
MVERVGMYWFIAPTYEQAKNIAWFGVNDTGRSMLDCFPPPLIAGKNNSDLLITLKNGSMLKLIGSEDVDRLVGTNVVGMVFSEAALQKKAVWEKLQPILLANKGWAAFNGTPRGKGDDQMLWPLWEVARRDSENWFSSILTIEQTARDAEGEDGGPIIINEDIERLRGQGDDEDTIQQEYYCSFSGAFMGSYYGQILTRLENEGRVREVAHEPALPVFTVWDLGVADATAVWFAQVSGREVRVIDYLENSGEGLPWYIKEVRNKPYVYSSHWAPHDIEVRELGSGVSRKDTAFNLGLYFRVVPNLPVQDGIDAVRLLLPRCFFDRRRCDKGLRALQGYSKEWNAKAGEYKSHPKHDHFSHGADAFRYLALIADRESSAYISQQTAALTDYEIFGEAKPDAGNVFCASTPIPGGNRPAAEHGAQRAAAAAGQAPGPKCGGAQWTQGRPAAR